MKEGISHTTDQPQSQQQRTQRTEKYSTQKHATHQPEPKISAKKHSGLRYNAVSPRPLVSHRVSLCVDVLEGVAAVPVHVSVTIGRAPVREQERHLPKKIQQKKNTTQGKKKTQRERERRHIKRTLLRG